MPTNKFQLVKCAVCKVQLDEAQQTVYYNNDKPMCEYCNEEHWIKVAENDPYY